MFSYFRVCDTKFPSTDQSKIISKNVLDSYRFRVTPILEGKIKLPYSETSRRFWQTPDTLVEIASEVVNRLPLPEAFKWKRSDVLNWIKKLGFPQYIETFKKNLINGRTLLLVDGSVLIKMNITDFDHIEIISKAIRDLFSVEKILRSRSISLPPRYPDTHYKLFQIRTGLKYSRTKRTDLWRKMKMLRKMPDYLTHWSILQRWLKHLPPGESERVGYAPRRKLYKAKTQPEIVPIPELPELSVDDALMPPYYYGLKTTDTKPKTRLNVLLNRPPRQIPITGAISILKSDLPHKYINQNSSFVTSFYIRPPIYKIGFPMITLFAMYTMFVVVIRRSLTKIRSSSLISHSTKTTTIAISTTTTTAISTMYVEKLPKNIRSRNFSI